MSATSLPRAFGPAVIEARMRTEPEDFRVDEVLGFEPSGEGEHLFLQVEKRGANTAWVAQRLAQWAGVVEHAVGYAGLKDRHAVTRQAFTVHLPRRIAPDLAALGEQTEFRLLSQAWHQRKLPRGALRGNRFVLRLREVHGDRAPIEARLATIARHGVPNYFGEQRFGREGANLAAARALFAGRRFARDKRSILISSARSEIFNAVLAERVQRGDWNHGIEGEVWMLDGTHSVFGPEPLDAALAHRCEALDVHPTGPMWGAGELRTRAAAQALEQDQAERHADLAAGLVAVGLKHERRALRLPIAELAWQWRDADLELAFFLPAGCYATSLLHALGDVTNAGVPAARDEADGDA